MNGPLPPEDSSDFDDSVCVLILMTRSFILDTLHFFRFFFRSEGCGVGGVGCGWWRGVCDPIFVFIKKNDSFEMAWKNLSQMFVLRNGMSNFFTLRNLNLKTILLTKSQSPINTISPIIMTFVLGLMDPAWNPWHLVEQ